MYLFAIGFSVKFKSSKVKAIPTQHKAKAEKLRKMIGIQTNTKPDIVVKSLIKMLLKDPDQLEILQYEKRI